MTNESSLNRSFSLLSLCTFKRNKAFKVSLLTPQSFYDNQTESSYTSTTIAREARHLLEESFPLLPLGTEK
jgi:hypothetical protein